MDDAVDGRRMRLLLLLIQPECCRRSQWPRRMVAVVPIHTASGLRCHCHHFSLIAAFSVHHHHHHSMPLSSSSFAAVFSSSSWIAFCCLPSLLSWLSSLPHQWELFRCWRRHSFAAAVVAASASSPQSICNCGQMSSDGLFPLCHAHSLATSRNSRPTTNCAEWNSSIHCNCHERRRTVHAGNCKFRSMLHASCPVPLLPLRSARCMCMGVSRRAIPHRLGLVFLGLLLRMFQLCLNQQLDLLLCPALPQLLHSVLPLHSHLTLHQQSPTGVLPHSMCCCPSCLAFCRVD